MRFRLTWYEIKVILVWYLGWCGIGFRLNGMRFRLTGMRFRLNGMRFRFLWYDVEVNMV